MSCGTSPVMTTRTSRRTGSGRRRLQGRCAGRHRDALSKWQRAAGGGHADTGADRAALQQGKPATIDQGQYDYLRGLMRAQDGMSAAGINHSLDKYPELRGAMGDAYRIMGNPNIQTAAGDHGGITNEPRNIQALLNDDLLYKTQGGGQVPQIPLNQFDALNDMLGHGNPDLRAGSDVDRALLSESARIVDLVDRGNTAGPHTPDTHGGKSAIPLGIADSQHINNTLNAMVDNASGDHQAVTDFLAGANDPNSLAAQRMAAATFNHFQGNDAFLDLTTHRFETGQDGVRHLFDWYGRQRIHPRFGGVRRRRISQRYGPPGRQQPRHLHPPARRLRRL